MVVMSGRGKLSKGWFEWDRSWIINTLAAAFSDIG